MKLLTIAVCLGLCVIIVWVNLRRRKQQAQTNPPVRPSSLFGTGDHAINVRSADNVRLLSEEQIRAMEEPE